MIASFKCKDTEKLYDGVCPQKYRPILYQAERKLTLIDAAETIEFLKSPPGSRLEKLTGDRRRQSSVRINQQWGVCFTFANGAASHLEIVDSLAAQLVRPQNSQNHRAKN
ncbi:MAG: proteic killer suppression protein [Candidatus Azotimanducaceae bacterium]